MASTFSNLKIELIGTGDQSGTWGTTTNTNLGTAIEEAITGRATANFSTDADLTLGYTDTNAAQVFRNLILNVTSGVSLTATRNLIVPTIEKQYLIENNTTGAQDIVVKTASGTGITVPNGRKAHLYANGTDVVWAFDQVDINGGTIDNVTIGGVTPAAGAFTTVDTTNIEVTNIKAKDGTAAMSIADSTGVVTVSTQLQVDNINLSTNTISSTDTNGNIVLAPNGTGDVQVDADTLRVGDSGAAATITTNGAGNLTLSTNEGTNSGTIVINQGVNGNIEIAPNGTGDVYVTADTLRVGDSNATATITTNGTGDLVINTNGGTNAGSITLANGANGNITIAPNGTGDVYVDADTLRVGDSNAAATITTNGTGNLVLNTNAGTNSGSITINQGSNGNIEVAPNGTGDVYLTADTVRIGDSNANATLTTNGTGDLILNTNSGTNSGSITIEDGVNGNITVAPNGTGDVYIDADTLRVGDSGVDATIQSNGSADLIIKTGNATTGTLTLADGANGNFTIALNGTGQVIVNAGAVGTPTVAPTGDTNTGIYFPSADTLGLVTGGVERVRVGSSGLATVGYSAATGAALSTTVAAKLLSANTTYTDSATAASGTVTHGTINSFDNPAIAASNASVTYTNASTVYIDGAPTAGSNVTITNPYALYVAAGATYLGGTVTAADPIVQQTDIGTAPNEIPLNQYLGALAYENSEWVTPQVGSGITGGTGTICKTSFATQGGIKVMQILIDLTGLNSGGTAGDIIGLDGTANPCYIAQIPSTYTVLGGRMTCLETPAGGDTDIDLYSATEGTGTEDTAISTLTETQIINAGTQSIGTVTFFAADPAANTYFYLVGQGTSNATYTAGRFLIEVFGA